MNKGDKQITDWVKLQKVTLNGQDLQQFKYDWDQCLAGLAVQPSDDQLKIFFLLQIEQLPVQHEFMIEYKIWCANMRPTDRSMQELYDKVDSFLANRLEKRNREKILAESLPHLGLTQAQKAKKVGGNDGKNDGKKITGTCYSWQNYGECKKHALGKCPYDHSPKLKNTGKDQNKNGKGKGKGKGKNGKSQSKAPAAGAASPRNSKESGTKVELDLSKLCQNHLKGKCTKGANCKYHHNEPCKFHHSGQCTEGDKCPFPHVIGSAKAATPAPKAAAKAGAAPGSI